LLMHYAGLGEFKPAESFLFSLLVEADRLGTARIHDSCPVDRILLMSVKVSRREKLEVSRNRRFSDMCLLSEIAFEPFDRIVSQEDLHVSFARQLLSGQRVLFWTKPGAETHSCHIDCLGSTTPHLPPPPSPLPPLPPPPPPLPPHPPPSPPSPP